MVAPAMSSSDARLHEPLTRRPNARIAQVAANMKQAADMTATGAVAGGLMNDTSREIVSLAPRANAFLDPSLTPTRSINL